MSRPKLLAEIDPRSKLLRLPPVPNHPSDMHQQMHQDSRISFSGIFGPCNVFQLGVSAWYDSYGERKSVYWVEFEQNLLLEPIYNLLQKLPIAMFCYSTLFCETICMACRANVPVQTRPVPGGLAFGDLSSKSAYQISSFVGSPKSHQN